MAKAIKKVGKDVRFLGNFLVGTSRLYVGDPCYARRGNGSRILKGAEKGVWGASVQMVNFGEGWGVRPGVLMAACINDNPKVSKWVTSYGAVPVDSGQVTIMDLKCVCPRGDFDGWYKDICDSHLAVSEQAAAVAAGVTSSSGLGDGMYDMKVGYDSAGRVVAVRVNFARHYGEGRQTRGW